MQIKCRPAASQTLRHRCHKKTNRIIHQAIADNHQYSGKQNFSFLTPFRHGNPPSPDTEGPPGSGEPFFFIQFLLNQRSHQSIAKGDD